MLMGIVRLQTGEPVHVTPVVSIIAPETEFIVKKVEFMKLLLRDELASTSIKI